MEAKCIFHLTCLGRGIYAELIKRDTLLQTCTKSDTVTSLIISTPTAEEDHTINKLVYLGLGVGINNTDRAKMMVMTGQTLQAIMESPKLLKKTIESEAPQQSTSYHDHGPGGAHRQLVQKII